MNTLRSVESLQHRYTEEFEYENEEDTQSTHVVEKIKSNDELKKKLENWNKINEIQKRLNNQIKKCRASKDELNTRICDYLVENELDKQRIQTNFGNFVIHERKEYGTITYSFLTETLKEMMKAEDAIRIVEFVKSKRSVKMKRELLSSG